MAEANNEAYVIDASGLIAGRVATAAATAAMHGRRVSIVNCEKAAISGRKRMIIDAWTRKYGMGVPKKGPFVRRIPDRFLRRIIRGMLPYKTERGREALRNVLCYVGTPAQLKGAKTVTFPNARVDKLPNARFMTVGALCKELGGKWHEQQ